MDLLFKLSAAGRSSTNTCRNLHRLIHRENMTVPVSINFVTVPVRRRRPVLKKVDIAYPVIYPSSWMKFLLRERSYLVLGGIHIKHTARWQTMLSEFWALHSGYDPLHSYCTRFLYTVVPAELYWKDATLDKLNGAFAADLCDLYNNGLTVDSPLGPTTIYFCVVGVKGDWVYLRKAMTLKTGWQCQRKCHLCTSNEWFNLAMDAPWRSEGGGPTPFKVDRSPLFTVPGLGAPERALVDPAHTWHIGSLGGSKYS
ncbi:unnamed protein product [Symbiodinium sp. CCMP2456]|nr:unnamed protein product [Symbiodinium sp. CCMP2456]